MILDERKMIILESIIRDYVETAEPVGSRAMVKKHDLKISAATVRNEMADLEDMGYLEQPHTSAGRIPSERGFRYYVDCMMEKETPGENEYAQLQQLFEQNIEDWEQVILGIAHFLSQITRYASFVIIPAVRFSEFRNLQLLPLDQGKALLLLVCNMGVIMHRIISIPERISTQDLQAITNLFNQVLKGKRLEELKRSDLQQIRENLSRRQRIIDNVLEAIDSLLQNTQDEKIMVSGALNILNEPEFKDMGKLKRILNIFEEDDSLRQIIPGKLGEAVDVKIGRENPLEEIREMSLVVAGYKSFGELGKIGVIGPVRMEYWKAVGTVESVRDIIEDYLKGLG